MRGVKRDHCRICGKHVDECGKLSARGKCAPCGEDRHKANNAELRAHSGPAFDHWRRQVAASVGALTLDDLDEPG